MLPNSSLRIYFGCPYPGAVKGIGLVAKYAHPVRVSLGQGAEHDHHLSANPYTIMELQSGANHAVGDPGINVHS